MDARVTLRGGAAALLLACSSADPSASTNSGRPAPIVGTWRASDYVHVNRGGSPDYPFGRPPRGYLVYETTGHVFFEAVRQGGISEAARGRWQGADSSSMQKLLRDAVAYFGTYTINASLGTVTHHLEGEIPPNTGTTEIATPFRINGDSLVLGPDSSSHWVFIRVR